MSFANANANINPTQNAMQTLRNLHPTFMHLRLFIESNDTELIARYINAINNNNNKLLNPNNQHIDAGFDLFTPREIRCLAGQSNKIDFEVICSAQIINNAGTNNETTRNSGFYMYPRSSISNTPLRLANSVGIIDAGYRGHLMGKFDCLTNDYAVAQFDRLLQICAPGLIPIYVELVNNVEQLGITERGGGGFGSTGR